MGINEIIYTSVVFSKVSGTYKFSIKVTIKSIIHIFMAITLTNENQRTIKKWQTIV